MRLINIQVTEGATVKIYEVPNAASRYKVEKIVEGKVVQTVRRFTMTAAMKVAVEMLEER